MELQGATKASANQAPGMGRVFRDTFERQLRTCNWLCEGNALEAGG